METCATAVCYDRKYRLRILREAYEQAFDELAAVTRRWNSISRQASGVLDSKTARERVDQAMDTYRKRRDALADVLRQSKH